MVLDAEHHISEMLAIQPYDSFKSVRLTSNATSARVFQIEEKVIHFDLDLCRI